MNVKIIHVKIPGNALTKELDMNACAGSALQDKIVRIVSIVLCYVAMQFSISCYVVLASNFQYSSLTVNVTI